MKYQFCIRFREVDVNSAASKAVLDCNKIFSKNGYRDFTFTVPHNRNRASYYPQLLKSMLVFFFSIKPGSTVGVQYPLLSINNVFKYFILLARLKRVSFFCVVHDLHSLRTGGTNAKDIAGEIANLNRFNCVIVHNTHMFSWLRSHGMKSHSIVLELFDYLSEDFPVAITEIPGEKVIVYAGNLIKSKFIYDLNAVKGCSFRLYGPGYDAALASAAISVKWEGQHSPEEIAKELKGNYGLIWDGESSDECDGPLGNYLQYNSPHKFSLYIAAGLPVIAPESAAIGGFIKANNLGLLISNLHDLEALTISTAAYAAMQANVLLLRAKIIRGDYFNAALKEVDPARQES